MKIFDQQLEKFRDDLISKVKIRPEFVRQVATQIQIEISSNKNQILTGIESATPVPIKTRLEELHCFQTMMETYNKMKPRPELIRSQVMTQNYICFVYLKDTLFEVLRKNSEPASVTKKCTKFLLNNPVRAFRHSIAHGNWTYLRDFSGLEFWAQKGEQRDEPMTRFTVSNEELNFWQMLSRATAYTAYLTLEEE